MGVWEHLAEFGGRGSEAGGASASGYWRISERGVSDV